ncbi:hypothetical protein E2C01_091204 [Portunus trituberculatus]|uniref:Uncharacterized protein n=1 Tax=Portunus trituberculatus TaxID=210409 RepID=A0A5B7JNE4_PORTR|nr:hypothetical protein [Portunus trituberculatus]
MAGAAASRVLLIKHSRLACFPDGVAVREGGRETGKEGGQTEGGPRNAGVEAVSARQAGNTLFPPLSPPRLDERGTAYQEKKS